MVGRGKVCGTRAEAKEYCPSITHILIAHGDRCGCVLKKHIFPFFFSLVFVSEVSHSKGLADATGKVRQEVAAVLTDRLVA